MTQQLYRLKNRYWCTQGTIPHPKKRINVYFWPNFGHAYIKRCKFSAIYELSTAKLGTNINKYKEKAFTNLNQKLYHNQI